MVNTYNYKPLSPGEIRILDLELLPDDETRLAPIVCYLRHVVLDDYGEEAAFRNRGLRETPTYEAVSYACE
jgi:hypothetical protein